MFNSGHSKPNVLQQTKTFLKTLSCSLANELSSPYSIPIKSYLSSLFLDGKYQMCHIKFGKDCWWYFCTWGSCAEINFECHKISLTLVRMELLPPCCSTPCFFCFQVGIPCLWPSYYFFIELPFFALLLYWGKAK